MALNGAQIISLYRSILAPFYLFDQVFMLVNC